MNKYLCYFYYKDGTVGEIIEWNRTCFTHDMYEMIWHSLLWDEDMDCEHYLQAEIIMGEYSYVFHRDYDGERTIERIPLCVLE